MKINELIKKVEDKKEILKSLHFIEDEIIACVCGECDCIQNNDDVSECEECGSDRIIFETAHEGLSCSCCNSTLDMYEDCFRSYGLDDLIYCKLCYLNLQIEIENLELDLESEIENEKS